MPDRNGFDESLTEVAWAKYDHRSLGTCDWLPLYKHLEDTAEVARLLFSKWFSDSQRALLSDALGGEELAGKLVVWLGAAHDVGKATVAFAMKAPPRRDRMEQAGYVFPPIDPPLSEQRRYPHGLAGQRAVREFLKERASGGRAVRAAQRFAEIVGGHHGAFPVDEDIPLVFAHGEAPCWRNVRRDLLSRADRLAGLDEGDWQRLLDSRVAEPLQALLTGFLIVCDWIASNQWYFPFEDRRSSAERAQDALAELGFGDHWRPDPGSSTEAYFAERFGIAEPRPVQLAGAALAAKLEEPSFVLIEAPTGEGKTEMGFNTAEIVALKFGLHGAMVVLPTRATANAMFGRVLRWLQTVQRGGKPVSMSLAHSKAQFDDRFQALFGRGSFSCTYDDDAFGSVSAEAVIANQWFIGRKRAGFADFVVGTIDQLLFMTLKAKHLVLRHLGYSGKAIIIDEIHAADDFMRTYLLRALEWLGAYGVPVIALSATLPPAQRRELLQAYRRGARLAQSGGAAADEAESEATLARLSAAEGYRCAP